MFKTTGLKTEILITLTILLGTALLLGGIMMLHVMEKTLLEERVGQLETLSQVLVHSLSDNSHVDSTEKQMALLHNLPTQSNYTAWWLYDQNLNLIGSYISDRVQPFSSSRRQLAKLSGEIQRKINFPLLINLFDRSDPIAHFLVPIKDESRPSGLLDISFSLSDIRYKLIKSQQFLVLYIVLYGAILVVAGYFLLQRNIIRPAKNLLNATLDVSRGSFDTHLPEDGPTEFTQLAAAYNQMVDALRLSHAETETHILSLEETNQKLEQTSAELIRSEKMASVGQLSAGLAHELGNPLAALIGYLEFFKGRITSSTDSDIIERSLVEATRIDFLVRELLDFARPDEEIQLEDIDLIVSLTETVQLLQNQGSFTEVEVINHLPATLPPIKVNRNKLQQVFVNILLNAVQACDVGGGKITLTGGSDEHIWIAIADNGVGIEKEDIERIFDPFFTTKSPGEGTGLGLAICQRIVVEAGGIIEVISRSGEGSIFKLEFWQGNRGQDA